MAFTIESPMPEAAGVTGAAVVEAGEPVEDTLAVLGRDAGAVVVDHELDGAARVVVQSTATVERAWRSALSSEVAHHACELVAPTVHAAGGARGWC